MKSNTLYKYINLLIRIIIGVGALWLIYDKLKNSFNDFISYEAIESANIGFVIIAFFLLLVNWGIEAIKWKYLIKSSVQLSFAKAFKLTIGGITLGLLTPNRIGEIPGRAALLNKKGKLKELILQTSVGAYAQLLVTVVLGTVAALFTYEWFNLDFSGGVGTSVFVAISLLLLMGYFFHNSLKYLFYKIPYVKNRKLLEGLKEFKFKNLLWVLVLSVLRYFVFAIQFYLLLEGFGFQFDSMSQLLLIPLCFMVASMIPTILISELGVRGSVALYIFGVASENYLAILLASVILWTINVAIPAIVGLLFINQFKVLSED